MLTFAEFQRRYHGVFPDKPVLDEEDYREFQQAYGLLFVPTHRLISAEKRLINKWF